MEEADSSKLIAVGKTWKKLTAHSCKGKIEELIVPSSL
jgi:hypothetical protein